MAVHHCSAINKNSKIKTLKPSSPSTFSKWGPSRFGVNAVTFFLFVVCLNVGLADAIGTRLSAGPSHGLSDGDIIWISSLSVIAALCFAALIWYWFFKWPVQQQQGIIYSNNANNANYSSIDSAAVTVAHLEAQNQRDLANAHRRVQQRNQQIQAVREHHRQNTAKQNIVVVAQPGEFFGEQIAQYSSQAGHSSGVQQPQGQQQPPAQGYKLPAATSAFTPGQRPSADVSECAPVKGLSDRSESVTASDLPDLVRKGEEKHEKPSENSSNVKEQQHKEAPPSKSAKRKNQKKKAQDKKRDSVNNNVNIAKENDHQNISKQEKKTSGAEPKSPQSPLASTML